MSCINFTCDVPTELNIEFYTKNTNVTNYLFLYNIIRGN